MKYFIGEFVLLFFIRLKFSHCFFNNARMYKWIRIRIYVSCITLELVSFVCVCYLLCHDLSCECVAMAIKLPYWFNSDPALYVALHVNTRISNLESIPKHQIYGIRYTVYGYMFESIAKKFIIPFVSHCDRILFFCVFLNSFNV